MAKNKSIMTIKQIDEIFDRKSQRIEEILEKRFNTMEKIMKKFCLILDDYINLWPTEVKN